MSRPQLEQILVSPSTIDGVSLDIVIDSSVIHNLCMRLSAGTVQRNEPPQSGSGQFVSTDLGAISLTHNSLWLIKFSKIS